MLQLRNGYNDFGDVAIKYYDTYGYDYYNGYISESYLYMAAVYNIYNNMYRSDNIMVLYYNKILHMKILGIILYHSPQVVIIFRDIWYIIYYYIEYILLCLLYSFVFEVLYNNK